MEIIQKNIRNFCIISHINHGKSTLADRFLEITRSVGFNKIDRILDSMDLEKERGITIKLNTAQMFYKWKDTQYLLNLIDTPGHIDFTYEVSKSLKACEGAIMLIDAAKGIQAQTISNLKLAIQAKLKIIPVINKIDLKHVEIEKVKKNIANLLKIAEDQILLISAKNNINIDKLLHKIIEIIPAPSGNSEKPLQALIFDAYYDQYQGVTGLICIKNGTLKLKDHVKFIGNNKDFYITNLQIKTPKLKKITALKVGHVGLFQGNIRSLDEINVGDTLTSYDKPALEALGGYKKMNAVVFANFFAGDQKQYLDFVKALGKIKLTDNSFFYQKTSSKAFGNGFHCGFLGLLHLEIIRARIQREHHLEMIVTYPNVKYLIYLAKGQKKIIDSLTQIEDWKKIIYLEEPIVNVQILTPIKYIGKINELVKKKRGKLEKEEILDQEHFLLHTKIPMNEIVIDFFDRLKSLSNGYASFDYQFSHYQKDDLVKLDILINHKMIPAFSQIIHVTKAHEVAEHIIEKLKTSIPKHNFEIALQGAIGNKVIARKTIKAYRKNVTAKCYGGDITRKRKLWEKQKKGKKRMKKFGNVKIPYRAFINVLKSEFK